MTGGQEAETVITSEKKIIQYRWIEDDLLGKTNLGYYKKGDLTPMGLELAVTHQASRVTVRKAMNNLVVRELLPRMAGVGTSVCHPSVTSNPAQIPDFTDVVKVQDMVPPALVTVPSLQKVSANIASILSIEKDEFIHFIRRQCYGNEELLQLKTSHMSAHSYPNSSIETLEKFKYHYFEQVKYMTIVYSHHTVAPTHPSREIAEPFDITSDIPTIKVANITRLGNGQVMDYMGLTLNPPKYQLTHIKR